MTELKLQSTVYSVKHAGSSLKAEGNATVSENIVQNISLRFLDASEKEVGYMNFSESASGSSYNYSFRGDDHKEEIRSMSDQIITDVKELIKA